MYIHTLTQVCTCSPLSARTPLTVWPATASWSLQWLCFLRSLISDNLSHAISTGCDRDLHRYFHSSRSSGSDWSADTLWSSSWLESPRAVDTFQGFQINFTSVTYRKETVCNPGHCGPRLPVSCWAASSTLRSRDLNAYSSRAALRCFAVARSVVICREAARRGVLQSLLRTTSMEGFLLPEAGLRIVAHPRFFCPLSKRYVRDHVNLDIVEYSELLRSFLQKTPSTPTLTGARTARSAYMVIQFVYLLSGFPAASSCRLWTLYLGISKLQWTATVSRLGSKLVRSDLLTGLPSNITPVLLEFRNGAASSFCSAHRASCRSPKMMDFNSSATGFAQLARRSALCREP